MLTIVASDAAGVTQGVPNKPEEIENSMTLHLYTQPEDCGSDPRQPCHC